MRYILAAAVTAATLTAITLTAVSASAFGLLVEFPTLTWPVTTTTPDLPTMGCADPASLSPDLCPAPSR